MTRVLIEFERTEDGRYVTPDGLCQVVPVKINQEQADAMEHAFMHSPPSADGEEIGQRMHNAMLAAARPTVKAVKLPEREEIPLWKCCDIERALGWNDCLDTITQGLKP